MDGWLGFYSTVCTQVAARSCQNSSKFIGKTSPMACIKEIIHLVILETA